MKNKGRMIFSLFDRFMTRVHRFLFVKIRWITVLLSGIFYLSIILLKGNQLKVSNNYFVIIPIITSSLSFGFRGGIITGTLALPCNLLLFHVLGHPEYSPESKIIAESFGILFGSVLGYVSDFFNKMNVEIERRKASQLELEKNLQIKEVLIKEIHHRVKNNLNLIKSLVQLQSNRLKDPEIKGECDKLNNRIFAISLVQELLFSQESQGRFDGRFYLDRLVHSIVEGFGERDCDLRIALGERELILESNDLSSLGLVVNEAITNALKYGIKDTSEPVIEVRLEYRDNSVQIDVLDNGKGFPEEKGQNGLGMKLMESLIRSLRGKIHFENLERGALVQITLPVRD